MMGGLVRWFGMLADGLRTAILATTIVGVTMAKAEDDAPPHHDGDKFKNLYTAPIDKGPAGFIKMRVFGDDAFANHEDNVHRVPVEEGQAEQLQTGSAKPRISWLGHSTFLIQYQGINILTDPILTDRASPISFAGPKRLVPMPIGRDELPEIHYIVISHNHYDHLDADTVEMFGDEPVYLVPLKLKKWFVDFGIGAHRVIEMDWWDETEFDRLKFTATPGQHWSGRTLFDRFETLWATWHIQIGDFSIWFGGDTGYNEIQFKEIGQRFAPIDLAMIPIGAYAPRWFMRQQHVNPEEAILIHKEIGARQSIGMHWGTFQLSAEPIDEPVKRIKQAQQHGLLEEGEFITMAIGEVMEVDH